MVKQIYKIALCLVILIPLIIADDTVVDEKKVKLEKIEILKIVDRDEIQRIANKTDENISQLNGRIMMLENGGMTLKSEVNSLRIRVSSTEDTDCLLDVTGSVDSDNILDQTIVGNDIDSTSEDFVFNDAYRATSVEPESILVTSTFAKSAAGDSARVAAGDSIAALRDGDVWTGVHDYGGATSLEIPNSTTPTVNAVGEIAHDTDDNTLIVGANGRVYAAEIKSQWFVIIDTVKATYDYPFWQTPDSIVITGVSAICSGGTNVVGCLLEYAGNGTTPVAIDADWTVTTSEYNDASFNDPYINAGDWIGWRTTSVSGDVAAFSLTFEYYIAK